MKIVSRATLLPIDNIDTDRIIPARFLTTTERTGMGEHLFEDWPEGAAVLDDARILVAGHNFGCGSSREHAVWSLVDRGFEAVIATGFADIFHANAVRNGLAPVIVNADDHVRLFTEIEADPTRPVILDFSVDRLTCGSINASFSAKAPSAHDTPGGTELDALLHQLDRITTWEADRPPRIDTREGNR